MALGVAGVISSAQIYRVPSRPAWNTPFTLAQFTLTAAVLGPLFAAAVGTGDSHWLAVGDRANAGAAVVVLALRFIRLPAADSVELQATGRLLATTLSSRLLTRGVLLMLGAIALPLYTVNPAVLWAAFAPDSRAAKLLGRYLFFVSVVPKHMTAPRISEARPHEHDAEAAARARYARGSLYVRRRPGAGPHRVAQSRRQLGADHLRLLLGRLRHVHRGEGWPGRHGPRQSGSSCQPRHAVSQRASRNTRRSMHRADRAYPLLRGPRRIGARELGSSHRDDGPQIPRDAGRGWPRVGGRDQHRSARHRGVLHPRQARAARPRHAELRRQHDALHVDGGFRLQAVVRQRRAAGCVRRPRASRCHPADRREHRRKPSDPLAAAGRQSRERRSSSSIRA